ncbi:hypothetical protein ABUW04_00360 [Streptacidiphilus sp. N1-10]|uniref:Uncharacterized protein n=1 Tax=Streptacidiphilus jeojiensis TaxID=3229225 RepID=A0ABV6XEK8_9ACTN
MGFSGHLVFGRSTQPLLAAPVFDDLHQEVKDTIRPWKARPGWWQTLELDNGLWESDYLRELVAWTNAPACVANVNDSDMALIAGLDPVGREWQACLNLETAASLLAAEPQDMDDLSLWVGSPGFHEAVQRKRAELVEEVPRSAEAALAWAAAAGITPSSRSGIEAVLLSHDTFAENLFPALLDALGFPAPIDDTIENMSQTA